MIRIFYNNYTAVLSESPEGNRWLLTGWENKEETTTSANGEVRDSSKATTVTPTLTRRNRDVVVSKVSISNPDEKVNAKKSNDNSNNLAPLKKSLSEQYKYMLENSQGDISHTIQKHADNYDNFHHATVEDIAPVMDNIAGKTYISMEDFANREGSIWNNVDFNDDATKRSIMQETHNNMVSEGSVVVVSDEALTSVEQSFPDLRTIKKKERTPILKEAMIKLKNNIRQFLNGLKYQNFEFEVNGKVLEAKLYNTGINEVLEKVTQEKANMLYSTEDIFKNSRYLYSTQDYDSDPNVYRWNYFYTPVQIGENIVGVRIAVRDLAKQGESQIYNWGIKKDTSLDGVRDDSLNRKSHDVSSDVSAYSISDIAPVVNKQDISAVETAEEISKIDSDVKLESRPKTRKQLHNKIVDNIKSVFSGKGFDFDEVLKKAKNLSTLSTVDNTPQRVMEKALGYKEGQALADLTVNKVAQNEMKGIKWLNAFTNRKNGLLAQLSKRYDIILTITSALFQSTVTSNKLDYYGKRY